MTEILKTFKNREVPGSDELNMELFKYAPTTAELRFLNILNICWTTYKYLMTEKKTIIPIFGKGDRAYCNNYRGISLLNSAYKVYAKVTARL
jgi:hypothetical protein